MCWVGLFVFVVDRFEIAEMEKIPTTMPNWAEIMTEFTKDLKLVKAHSTIPALSTYEYSKTKMKENLEYTAKTEILTQETDVSKTKVEALGSFKIGVCVYDVFFTQ